MTQKTGLLLANLGSPASLTVGGVRQFLKEFLGDKRVVNLPRPLWLLILHGVILPFRPKKSLHAYQAIWNSEKGSPLIYLTRQLTQTVAELLTGSDISVDYVMRYGKPTIKAALHNFKEQGINNIIVLPLYPQYSSTTTASTYDDFIKEITQWRHIPSFTFISDYHNHPAYINAIANSVKNAWHSKPKNELLLLSFHGLPAALTKMGDPYYYQCQETARLIAQQLELKEHEWRLVFQSRFGKAEWLKPYCVETLESLPSEGIKNIDVLCAGFAVDCLETLEEIAITNKELFISAGGEDYQYIPCLNDSREHAELLLELIK
jgi:ferrochelatase